MSKLIIAIILAIVVLGGFFFLYKISNKVKSGNLNTAYINTNNPVATGVPVDTINNSITLDSFMPSDGLTVTTSSIVFTGKTIPNADVSVNETDTKADSSGNFWAKIDLDEGENVITVVANDQSGNFVEKEITITYSPAQ
jgi:Glucodextranase, domain B